MTYKKPFYRDAVTVITHDGIAYSILGDYKEGLTVPSGVRIVAMYTRVNWYDDLT